jgi:hypothetical protein
MIRTEFLPGASPSGIKVILPLPGLALSQPVSSPSAKSPFSSRLTPQALPAGAGGELAAAGIGTIGITIPSSIARVRKNAKILLFFLCCSI